MRKLKIRRRGAVPPDIEEQGAEANRVRDEVGRLTYEINVQQYACAGLNFGIYYDRSPIIAYDGSKASRLHHGPLHGINRAGLPHRRIFSRADGGSLIRCDGPEFTLLRFDSSAERRADRSGGAFKGVPLKVLDLERPDGAGYDGHSLVLSRPDQHVAWRGARLPADPLGLIDRVRGAVR